MRPNAVLAPACALALVLTACSTTSGDPEASASNVGDISMVTVVQSETLAPDVEFEPGLDYAEEQIEVLWTGEGEALQDGQPLLLDIYAESLVDGTVIENTFDGVPASFLMAPEIVGEGIYEALREVNVGGRVLVVSPPGDGEEEWEPVALVVDVLPTHAEGDELEPVAGMPTVESGPPGEPIVSVAEDREISPELQVSTIVSGVGAQVRANSHVTANYVMVYNEDSPADEDAGLEAGDEWAAGDVFDSTWTAERKPLVLEMDEASAVPGLQQGLLDQTAGSRVLMVVPPTLGYPESGSMIIVVDILDVWTPEEL